MFSVMKSYEKTFFDPKKPLMARFSEISVNFNETYYV